MANKSTPTTSINLLGRELTVPAPYAEGHTINPIEAKVLNRTLAENIANNTRKLFKAIDEGADGAMSEDDALAAFTKYASEYEFTEAAAGGSRSTLSPVEKWAKKIARDFVKEALGKKGVTVKAYKEAGAENEAKYDAEVARIADLPKVKALAEKRAAEEAEERKRKEAEMAAISDAEVEIAA